MNGRIEMYSMYINLCYFSYYNRRAEMIENKQFLTVTVIISMKT